MDVATFRALIPRVAGLSAEQRNDLESLLSGSGPEDDVITAIETRLGDHPRCPHCGAGWVVRNGRNKGLRRFQCRICICTFNALTGTPLAGLRKKGRWLDFAQSLADGDSVRL